MTVGQHRMQEIITAYLPRLTKAVEKIADMQQPHKECCCICGKEIIGYGNNAYPYGTTGNDRCCDECNVTKVIPERIRLTSKMEK